MEKAGVNVGMGHGRKLIFVFVMFFVVIGIGWPVGAQSTVTPDGNMEWLANPELITEDDIAEFVRQNAAVFTMPESNMPGDSGQYQLLKQEAGFFVKFIHDQATDDRYQNLSGKLFVRMPRSMDNDLRASLIKSMLINHARLTRQWEKLGLKKPRGFIFVWIISNLDKMRREFSTDPNIMAFALPCRYMVVPYEVISDNLKYDMEARALLDNGNLHEARTFITRYLQKSFSTNFTHELTHVFTFSTMGFGRINDLDKWFYEAAAIWLSRDNGMGLSEEYKNYKKTFDFIRMKYGNQRFQRFVREGIKRSIPGSLTSNLGLPHYGALARETKQWYGRMHWMEIVFSVLAVLCLGLAVGRWIKGCPAYLCYLNLCLMAILYGLIFGFYNLWTNSITGSLILNLLGLLSVIFLVLFDIRYFYYRIRLSQEIRMAAENMEAVAQDTAQYPLEFENYQNMMELARLNQMRWTPWDGLRWAKDASQIARATPIERIKK
jgi:hypothetical protein